MEGVKCKHAIVQRPGYGTNGRRIRLLTNHFKVTFKSLDAVFYQYTVAITSQDGKTVGSKLIAKKLMDKLYQTYSSELSYKEFAYDGQRSLYTVGPLPCNNQEFTVILEESFSKGDESPSSSKEKRLKHSLKSKIFKVELAYVTSIPLRYIDHAIRRHEVDNGTQDVLRVLNTILRQHAANRGCLIVKQSFFQDDYRSYVSIGEGVEAVRGFYSSIRPIEEGLSLNMDVSNTLVLKPGPVINFLLENQKVNHHRDIQWPLAKKMLKNMRIKTRHQNLEYRITGLSEKLCFDQTFLFKVKNEDTGEINGIEITVHQYFTKHLGIPLDYSVYMPCLDVGKPRRHIYLPLELCSMVSLQRYTKTLSSSQKTSFVEKSRQNPNERINNLIDVVRRCKYNENPMLSSCGNLIGMELTEVEGRVLNSPKLIFGKNEIFTPRNGRWNFYNKSLFHPTYIDSWAVVNFSIRCDISYISHELIKCGRRKGFNIKSPGALINEDDRSKRNSATKRVQIMFEELKAKMPNKPSFILCVLSEKKNCDIYGPWKKKCLCDFGIVTQCINAPPKVDDRYITNVLLKINAKLGGINSLLAMECSKKIPLIQDTPTLILGIDVCHGPPGQNYIPSIASVVGSQCWPLVSKYRASVRTQSPKLEMIDALYQHSANGVDNGIIRELVEGFRKTSEDKSIPKQIIIFRDGVGESQFQKVLDFEVNQIIKAFVHHGWDVPKFTVIICQKIHHTRLFQLDGRGNVPPGTVVDSRIVHPRNFDFYLCAHEGKIGTSRPVRYHVLLDEIGFSPAIVQDLINSLSYAYQRSTNAISIVAPIMYAHHAAAQMAHLVKLEDNSGECSGSKSTSSGAVSVPQLPRLHRDVEGSMFFC